LSIWTPAGEAEIDKFQTLSFLSRWTPAGEAEIDKNGVHDPAEIDLTPERVDDGSASESVLATR